LSCAVAASSTVRSAHRRQASAQRCIVASVPAMLEQPCSRARQTSAQMPQTWRVKFGAGQQERRAGLMLERVTVRLAVRYIGLVSALRSTATLQQTPRPTKALFKLLIRLANSEELWQMLGAEGIETAPSASQLRDSRQSPGSGLYGSLRRFRVARLPHRSNAAGATPRCTLTI
jgi:hypothetical protein